MAWSREDEKKLDRWLSKNEDQGPPRKRTWQTDQSGLNARAKSNRAKRKAVEATQRWVAKHKAHYRQYQRKYHRIWMRCRRLAIKDSIVLAGNSSI